MKVADFMTRQVRTIHPDTPLRQAAELMAQGRVSGLPVCDAAGGLVGILSEGDLLRLFQRLQIPTYIDILGGVFPVPPPASLLHQLREVTAYRTDQLMTRRVVTVGPEDDVAEAARRLRAHGVKRLPVLDADGRLVGIISRGDVVRAFIS